MRTAFFILISLLIGIDVAVAAPCSSLVGRCDFYRCVGEQTECPTKSLTLGSAPVYCERFEAKRNSFTSIGREVLDRIKVCLQLEVEGRHARTCREADEAFVEAHVDCYLSEGFCELSPADQSRIARIGFSALRYDSFRRATLDILEACRRRWSR